MKINSKRTRLSTKRNSKKNEVLYLSRNPRQCTLHESGNALQLVEMYKYLGVVFTNDGRRFRKIDTRIGKANAVQPLLRELCRTVVTKRKLSNRVKLSFTNRYLVRSLPIWS